MQFPFVLLLVLAVALVFLAPSIELEPTALRASQAAKALLLALISAALVFANLLCFAGFYSPREGTIFGPVTDCDLLVLNCTRLC